MKTLKQILKGVTAGGQWEQHGCYVYAIGKKHGGNVAACGEPRATDFIAYTPLDIGSPDLNEAHSNAAYAARAARNFPKLVRLAQMAAEPDEELSAFQVLAILREDARAVLDEALKE